MSQKPGLVRQILMNTRLAALLLLSGLFLLGLMVLTVWGDYGLREIRRKQHEIQRLVREVDAIEQENARLVREIQRLRTDMSYLEKIAREDLGLVRPKELVFEFVE